MIILPLCDFIEIAPGLWLVRDTDKTLADFVREQAESIYGDIATLSIDGVEVDGDTIRVQATARIKPTLQAIQIQVRPVG